jgi:glutamate synthase domain-containing protein 1
VGNAHKEGIEYVCGIVGLFCKSTELESQLGEYLGAMLAQMGDRGPDSAGVAVYRDPAPPGSSKLTLYAADPAFDWEVVRADFADAFGGADIADVRARHCVLVVDADAADADTWIRRHRPDLGVMSAGRVIEIYKEVGEPARFVDDFQVAEFSGTHGLGHTRMATESRVTTAGSHPFSTGLDLCLVHNGSLSNHNRLRESLRREGVGFQTENDTEVAAGYLAWRMREGATLEQALEGCLEDLDGFYTFLVGTADGFAVLRDPIACKPAVLAETDDWVAMASEYRAIAVLPGASTARMWEPQPRVVYAWERVLV